MKMLCGGLLGANEDFISQIASSNVLASVFTPYHYVAAVSDMPSMTLYRAKVVVNSWTFLEFLDPLNLAVHLEKLPAARSVRPLVCVLRAPINLLQHFFCHSDRHTAFGHSFGCQFCNSVYLHIVKTQ